MQPPAEGRHLRRGAGAYTRGPCSNLSFAEGFSSEGCRAAPFRTRGCTHTCTYPHKPHLLLSDTCPIHTTHTTRAHTHPSVHTQIRVFTHTRIYVVTHMRTHSRYVYTHSHVCTRTRTHAHIQTHKHTHTFTPAYIHTLINSDACCAATLSHAHTHIRVRPHTCTHSRAGHTGCFCI